MWAPRADSEHDCPQPVQPQPRGNTATNAALRGAFDLLDADRDGLVSARDLRVVLALGNGENQLTDEQIAAVLEHWFPGKLVLGRASDLFLDFADFCAVMLKFNGDSDDAACDMFLDKFRHAHRHKRRLTNLPSSHSLLLQSLAYAPSGQATNEAGEPSVILPTARVAGRVGMGSPERSARLRLVKRLNSTKVQVVLVLLVLVDAFAVMAEILLHEVTGHAPDTCPGQTPHKDICHDQLVEVCDIAKDNGDRQHHLAHEVHMLSLGILCVFMAQILLVLFGLGRAFFANPFFVVDLVVVGTAIVLESLPGMTEAGLLPLLLIWRVVRVVHALGTTLEVHKTKVSKGREKEMKTRHTLAQSISTAIEAHQHLGDIVLGRIRDRKRERRKVLRRLNGGASVTSHELAKQLDAETAHIEELEEEYSRLFSTVQDVQKALDVVRIEDEGKRRKLMDRMSLGR